MDQQNKEITYVSIIEQLEAKKLIDESGLKVQSAIQLSEAAALVKKAVA